MVKLASIISRICTYIADRCNHYIELKIVQEIAHEGFPAEWFMSDEQLEKLEARESEEWMYKPLPNALTIKPSDIEGLGLFATEDIPNSTSLGVCHITDKVTKELIRTPLGGFINHSEKPNCRRVEIQRFFYLETITDIKKGEEITLKYTAYSVYR